MHFSTILSFTTLALPVFAAPSTVDPLSLIKRYPGIDVSYSQHVARDETSVMLPVLQKRQLTTPQCWDFQSNLGYTQEQYTDSINYLYNNFKADNDVINVSPDGSYSFGYGQAQIIIRNQSSCKSQSIKMSTAANWMKRVMDSCIAHHGWLQRPGDPPLTIIAQQYNAVTPSYYSQC